MASCVARKASLGGDFNVVSYIFHVCMLLLVKNERNKKASGKEITGAWKPALSGENAAIN